MFWVYKQWKLPQRDTIIGPYDFRDAENVDRITESSHKNRIYSLMRNITEFVKVWMY